MRVTPHSALLVVGLALASAQPWVGAAAGAQRGGSFAGTPDFKDSPDQSQEMGAGQVDEWRTRGDRRPQFRPYLRSPWRGGRWLFWGAMSRAGCGFALERFPGVSDGIAIQTRQPETGQTIADLNPPAPPCPGLHWTDAGEGWNPPGPRAPGVPGIPPRPPAPWGPPAPAVPEAPPAPPNW